MASERFLVVIETQRVKGYLFASPILRETRGGSLLLDKLNRIKTKSLPNAAEGDIVYLGGGSGRVLFAESKQAKEFAEKVRELYQRETGNARASVEVVQRHDNESFTGWVARGVRESQKNKLARTEAVRFIYADGNRMGETIKQMKDLFADDAVARQAYHAFSCIVDQATREAAVQAVLEKVGDWEDKTLENKDARYVPAEFVLAGGDDVILIVPAHTALEVAARFLLLFQERTKKLQCEWVLENKLARSFAPDGLTTSAGVVLAHASYPASQLLDLAWDLMKLAKRKAADLAKQNHVAGSKRRRTWNPTWPG